MVLEDDDDGIVYVPLASRIKGLQRKKGEQTFFYVYRPARTVTLLNVIQASNTSQTHPLLPTNLSHLANHSSTYLPNTSSIASHHSLQAFAAAPNSTINPNHHDPNYYSALEEFFFYQKISEAFLNKFINRLDPVHNTLHGTAYNFITLYWHCLEQYFSNPNDRILRGLSAQMLAPVLDLTRQVAKAVGVLDHYLHDQFICTQLLWQFFYDALYFQTRLFLHNNISLEFLVETSPYYNQFTHSYAPGLDKLFNEHPVGYICKRFDEEGDFFKQFQQYIPEHFPRVDYAAMTMEEYLNYIPASLRDFCGVSLGDKPAQNAQAHQHPGRLQVHDEHGLAPADRPFRNANEKAAMHVFQKMQQSLQQDYNDATSGYQNVAVPEDLPHIVEEYAKRKLWATIQASGDEDLVPEEVHTHHPLIQLDNHHTGEYDEDLSPVAAHPEQYRSMKPCGGHQLLDLGDQMSPQMPTRERGVTGGGGDTHTLPSRASHLTEYLSFCGDDTSADHVSDHVLHVPDHAGIIPSASPLAPCDEGMPSCQSVQPHSNSTSQTPMISTRAVVQTQPQYKFNRPSSSATTTRTTTAITTRTPQMTPTTTINSHRDHQQHQMMDVVTNKNTPYSVKLRNNVSITFSNNPHFHPPTTHTHTMNTPQTTSFAELPYTISAGNFSSTFVAQNGNNHNNNNNKLLTNNPTHYHVPESFSILSASQYGYHPSHIAVDIVDNNKSQQQQQHPLSHQLDGENFNNNLQVPLELPPHLRDQTLKDKFNTWYEYYKNFTNPATGCIVLIQSTGAGEGMIRAIKDDIRLFKKENPNYLLYNKENLPLYQRVLEQYRQEGRPLTEDVVLKKNALTPRDYAFLFYVPRKTNVPKPAFSHLPHGMTNDEAQKYGATNPFAWITPECWRFYNIPRWQLIFSNHPSDDPRLKPQESSQDCLDIPLVWYDLLSDEVQMCDDLALRHNGLEVDLTTIPHHLRAQHAPRHPFNEFKPCIDIAPAWSPPI